MDPSSDASAPLLFIHHDENVTGKTWFRTKVDAKFPAFAALHSQKVNLDIAIVAPCEGVRSSGVSPRFWC